MDVVQELQWQPKGTACASSLPWQTSTQSGHDKGLVHARQVRWCCPNRLLATSERIDGLSIGGRQLLALRLAVEKLAGPEAVGKMTLLLHLAEEMEEPVLADLRAHNLYG